MNRKAKYSIGDIFKINLNDKNLAIGVVLRANFKGSVLGYFFLTSNKTTFDVTQLDLDKSKIVMRCMFGDLGLIKGEWTVVGNISKDNEIFKIPIKGFYRYDDEDGKYYISQYDENLDFVSENKVSKINDLDNYIEDSSYGYGLVEKVLLKKV